MRSIEHGTVRAPAPGIFRGMVQFSTWVSVHCAQCGDSPVSIDYEEYWTPEDAALHAAAAERWQVGPGGQLWCSACAPVLTCTAEGHEFSGWRRPVTRDGQLSGREYRHCRRCCQHDFRPARSLINARPRWATSAALLAGAGIDAGEVA